jgi:hypothetical protein
MDTEKLARMQNAARTGECCLVVLRARKLAKLMELPYWPRPQGKSETHQIRSPPHSRRMNKELEMRTVAYTDFQWLVTRGGTRTLELEELGLAGLEGWIGRGKQATCDAMKNGS